MSSRTKSASGLRSILIKLNRTNNGNLEDLPSVGDNSEVTDTQLGYERTKPFSEWNIDEVCDWFREMDLGMYADDIKKWFKNDCSDSMNVSTLDFAKSIAFKSFLHQKKVKLALNEMTSRGKDDLLINSGKLDTSWAMRWLDDIGLPQHKEMFLNARIDGRMLHLLTYEDLAALHVTSALHAASIRRAIQIMRENNWHPNCLVRRSFIQQTHNDTYSQIDSKNVRLWTSHRVMEWLREVNLAEYAPNLRGAGVHGALLVYDDRFTDALLADSLSIPSTKTLIRRHLFMQFNDLLGREIIQRKRQAETTLGYQPLTPISKIKSPKRTQFCLKWKRNTNSGDDWMFDLVCPLREIDEDLSTDNRRRGCF